MKQKGGEEINAQNTLNKEEPSLSTNDNTENINAQNTLNKEEPSLITNDNTENINAQNTLNQEEPSLNTDYNTESINYLYLYSRGGHSSNKKMNQKGSCICSKNDIHPVIKGGGENMRGGCLDCPSGKKKVLSYLNVICKNVSNIKKEFDKSTNISKSRKAGGNISSAFFDVSYLDLDTRYKFDYSLVEGNKSLLT